MASKCYFTALDKLSGNLNMLILTYVRSGYNTFDLKVNTTIEKKKKIYFGMIKNIFLLLLNAVAIQTILKSKNITIFRYT